MDNPKAGRSVTLRHKTVKYVNIESFEAAINLTHKSLIIRSRAEGTWSEAEREQMMKDLDDYSDMLDEYMVWTSEFDLYSRCLEQNLRKEIANLPDPFGPSNA